MSIWSGYGREISVELRRCCRRPAREGGAGGAAPRHGAARRLPAACATPCRIPGRSRPAHESRHARNWAGAWVANAPPHVTAGGNKDDAALALLTLGTERLFLSRWCTHNLPSQNSTCRRFLRFRITKSCWFRWHVVRELRRGPFQRPESALAIHVQVTGRRAQPFAKVGQPRATCS